MIVLKSEHKTTRLTVCNYDSYQDERNANETKKKRKRNANETQTTPTKEGEESKEVKEGHSDEQPEKPKLSNEETFELFWDHFHTTTKKPKEKKSPTFKHWKKLKLEEQQKAYGSVVAFSKSNVDKTFLPIARTYLSDKVFNDEFVIGKQTGKAETYEQIVARTQGSRNYTF
jgi:hypothetical protein